MSDWVKVSGYMIISPEIPNIFGKYKDNEEWSRELLYDPNSWVASILPESREKCNYTYNYKHVLPSVLYIDWVRESQSGGVIHEDEIVNISDIDKKKLSFPTGSEGPLDLSITPRLSSAYGLVYHVVFDGSLRDRSELEPIKDWWSTIKKYLVINRGYIYASSLGTEYSDFIQ